MNYSLSDADILMLRPTAKFTPYSSIKYMKSIHDILSPQGEAFILYQTTPTYGHWTTLFVRDGKLSYFNSYGKEPDDDLNMIDPKMRRILNEVEPHLFELMAKSGYQCEYNDVCVQKPHVATCGRHCAVRILNKDLTPDQYIKNLFATAKALKTDTDGVVVELTRNKLGI